MAAKFDNFAFEKKLKDLDSSQTSIQTLSLWIMHHTKYAKYIVNSWLGYLKKVPPDRRLVLFYLANDVIQNSRKKNKELVSAFGKVVKAGLPLLNHVKIKPPVERVLKIWEERKIYNHRYIEDLKESLADDDSIKPKKTFKTKEKEPVAEAKPVNEVKKIIPKDFKLSKVLNHMKKMKSIDEDLSLKSRKLSMLKVDASDLEAVKQVKDRCGVDSFVQEFEESKLNLDEYCKILNRSISEKKSLVEHLAGADAYFDTGYVEAKTIVKAYKTFGSRLSAIKKKLDARLEKIKAQELAAKEEAEKEAAAKEAEAAELAQKEAERKAQEELDATIDKVEVEDMELESDSGEESNTEEVDAADENSTDGSKVKDNDDDTTKDNRPDTFVFDDAPSPISSSSDDSILSPVGTPEGLNLDNESSPSVLPLANTSAPNNDGPSIILPLNFPTMPGIPFQLPPTLPTTDVDGNVSIIQPDDIGNESSSRASTPVQDEDDAGQPLPTAAIPEQPPVKESSIEMHETSQQEKVGSILDSLFPMLSKSLQTIRQQEATRSSPGNQSTPDDAQDIVSPSSNYDADDMHHGKRQRLNTHNIGSDVQAQLRSLHQREMLDRKEAIRQRVDQRRSRSPPFAHGADLERRRQSVEHLKRVHDSITSSQYPVHGGIGMGENARRLPLEGSAMFYRNRRSPTPELDSHIDHKQQDQRRSATPELDSSDIRLTVSRGDTTPPLTDNSALSSLRNNGHLMNRFLQGPTHLRGDLNNMNLPRMRRDFESPVDIYERRLQDKNGLDRDPFRHRHPMPPFNHFDPRDSYPEAVDHGPQRHTNYQPQHLHDDGFAPRPRYIRHPLQPRGPTF